MYVQRKKMEMIEQRQQNVSIVLLFSLYYIKKKHNYIQKVLQIVVTVAAKLTLSHSLLKLRCTCFIED